MAKCRYRRVLDLLWPSGEIEVWRGQRGPVGVMQPLSRLTKTLFVALLVVPLAVIVFRANDVRDREVNISFASQLSDRRIQVETVCLPPERLRPEVRETARTVTVTVTALDYDPANGEDCLRSLEVVLETALGDRRLIDGSSGNEVSVNGR